MRAIRSFLYLGASLLMFVGCRSQPTPANADAAVRNGGVEVRSADGARSYGYGRAEVEPNGLLLIRLTSEPAACGTKNQDHELQWALPYGTGPTQFLGTPIGLTSFAHGVVPDRTLELPSHGMMIKHESFDTTKGSKIRGTFGFSGRARLLEDDLPGPEVTATGSFEAVLCDDATSTRPVPTPPTGMEPVRGSLAGKPFVARRALAFTENHGGNDLHVKVIELYEDETTTCQTNNRLRRSLHIEKIGGSSAQTASRLRGPQPASTWFRTETSFGRSRGNNTTVLVTSLGFAPGDRLTGSMSADWPGQQLPEGAEILRVSGHFEAEVCGPAPSTPPMGMPSPP